MSPDIDAWCGVDLGTTNIKVLLLAADGRVLWRESRPTPRVSDGIGPCTDAEQLFEAVEGMILRAHAASGLRTPLRGICTGGTGEDGVPLGDALRPLDLAIPWNDRRADIHAARMAQTRLWSRARLPVGIDSARTAAKWAWLHENRPGLMERAAVWVALTDYPAARWTQRPFMSQTLAARTACYDIVDGAWLTPLLQACGAPPLPPVLAGGTVLGPVVAGNLLGTGVVDARTRVVVGGHDHPMAASLVCSLYPGAALDSMGTAELVYVEGPAAGPAPRNTLFAASLPVQGEAVAWLGVFELSGTLDPILAASGPMRDLFERVMAGEAIPAPPGSEGLRFLPWLGPNQLPEAAPAPLRLRAVLEGCAMVARRLLEEAAVLAGPLGTIFVAGGWARSNSFLQLRADVLGARLHRATEPQLSALGSAVLAARGCGASTPLAGLASDIVAPVRDHLELYDTLYESYRPSIEAHFCRPVGAQQ